MFILESHLKEPGVTQSWTGVIPRAQAIVWSSIGPLVEQGTMSLVLFIVLEQACAGQHGLVTQTAPVWRHWLSPWQTRPHSGSPHISPGWYLTRIWVNPWGRGQSRTYQEVCLLSCTLLHKWVQYPILPQNLIDTKCWSRSYQRRNVPGVICDEKWDIMVHFTWGTLPLARHADCGRWVTGSLHLQHCQVLAWSGLLFPFCHVLFGQIP